jgi:fructoselysine-6-P-deglycase FrlB-like protein
MYQQCAEGPTLMQMEQAWMANTLWLTVMMANKMNIYTSTRGSAEQDEHMYKYKGKC